MNFIHILLYIHTDAANAELTRNVPNSVRLLVESAVTLNTKLEVKRKIIGYFMMEPPFPAFDF